MSDQNHVPLLGLFRALRSAGMALTIRDYLEMLEAIRELSDPFGDDTKYAHKAAKDEIPFLHGPQREEMRWLLKSFWARSQRERRILDETITGAIPPPPPDIALRYARSTASFDFDLSPSPDPPPTTIEEIEERDNKRAGLKRARTSSKRTKESKAKAGNKENTTDQNENSGSSENDDQSDIDADQVLHASPSNQGNTALPTVDVAPTHYTQRYGLRLRASFDTVWMTALWRRMFIPKLEEDQSELDLRLTINMAAENGGVLHPVFRKRRRNAASLLVIFDVGEGMHPWRVTTQVMLDTLKEESCKFQDVTNYFFEAVPGRRVFHTMDLVDGIDLETALIGNGEVPVLIIGDAGAARPVGERQFRRMSAFLERLGEGDSRRVAWVNPVPKRYWAGTPMEQVARSALVNAIEMDDDGLIEAIDALRGIHQ